MIVGEGWHEEGVKQAEEGPESGQGDAYKNNKGRGQTGEVAGSKLFREGGGKKQEDDLGREDKSEWNSDLGDDPGEEDCLRYLQAYGSEGGGDSGGEDESVRKGEVESGNEGGDGNESWGGGEVESGNKGGFWGEGEGERSSGSEIDDGENGDEDGSKSEDEGGDVHGLTGGCSKVQYEDDDGVGEQSTSGRSRAGERAGSCVLAAGSSSAVGDQRAGEACAIHGDVGTAVSAAMPLPSAAAVASLPSAVFKAAPSSAVLESPPAAPPSLAALEAAAAAAAAAAPPSAVLESPPVAPPPLAALEAAAPAAAAAAPPSAAFEAAAPPPPPVVLKSPAAAPAAVLKAAVPAAAAAAATSIAPAPAVPPPPATTPQILPPLLTSLPPPQLVISLDTATTTTGHSVPHISPSELPPTPPPQQPPFASHDLPQLASTTTTHNLPSSCAPPFPSMYACVASPGSVTEVSLCILMHFLAMFNF